MKMLLWLALAVSLFLGRVNLSNAAVSDISYKLPSGWKAVPESWGIRFVVTEGNDDVFKPEVTLRVRKGSLNIDEASGKDFTEIIKKQLAAGGWSNINLREPRVFEFRPDFNGLLYYGNIEAAGNLLGQSIAVFSSQSEHYIFTYTDLPEHFEVGQDKTFQESRALVRRFRHTDGWVKSKWRQVASYGFAGLFLLFTIVSFLVFRSILARREYERLARDIPEDWGQDQGDEQMVLPQVSARIKSQERTEKDDDVV
jgi:hypothetical protein